MAAYEQLDSDGDMVSVADLTEEGLRQALAEARAALRDVHEAIHTATRKHEVEANRARHGLVDFMHYELQLPLATIESDCVTLRATLPSTAPGNLRDGFDSLQEQITQLRKLLERTVTATRDSHTLPF